MKTVRTSRLLWWSVPVLSVALVPIAAAKNPIAHVDIKTVKSYQGQNPLPKPERVVVYDFTAADSAVQTDKHPGVRQRMKGNSKDAAAQQVEDQITSDLVKGLQKRLKSSGIPVEKGTPDMEITGNMLVVHGTVTQLSQGHRLRRGTVGLGAGASNVKTDCQISMQAGANTELVSELTTEAQSGKKPGAAVTMGAGAAPAVAAGATGATAHKSTAQGDASRTGSALAKHIAGLMQTQGWIQPEKQQVATTQPKQ